MAVKVREWKGAWWIFLNYRKHRKAKRVGVGKEGKRAAHAAAELALGDLSPLAEATTAGPVVTFRGYAERWLESHVRLRCKPSTHDHYQDQLRCHWFPEFGNVPLTAITRDRIKAILAELSRTHRASSIRANALVALQGCLTTAVEEGRIPGNPAARLGRFIRSDVLPAERLDPFTREEVTCLLATAEAQMPEWYPCLLALARAGLRVGEMAALRPEDLDFRDFAVLVRRAIYRGRLSTPKNKKGRRVDMSQQLARVLESSLTLRRAEAVVSGREPSPWLFQADGGGPLDYRAFHRSVWQPLLRRAGVRYRSPHQLRHTFASLLIQQGESLAYVRDQLGHHSIKLTVDTYGHLIPGTNRQAVNRLDDETGRNLYATVPGVVSARS